MLHTEFQAYKPKGSQEEGFLNIYMYFYGSNPGPGGYHLNKLGNGPLAKATYHISST